jgi:predicted GTPase
MIELIKSLLSRRSSQYYLFLTLIVVMPLLTLLSLGYYFLWINDWALWFNLAILGFSIIAILLRHFLIKETEQQDDEVGDLEAPVHLSPVSDWSINDIKVWEKSLLNIESLQLSKTDWGDVFDAMLDQIAFVAANYNQGTNNFKYAFTIPEMLLMLETSSREYRGHILEKFPLSQNIKLSTLMGISETSTKAFDVYKKYSHVLDAVTAVFTAGASVPRQVASKLSAEFGKGLSEHMQANLKQLLFEQVSQVAIDLYSGRLKLSEAELSLYRKSLAVEEDVVVRPLSVMVLGQVNAGKSSLVNALLEKSVAEVDVISATAGFHHYQLSLTDDVDIILKDSPGIDGNKAGTAALLEEASNADLLLWLSQANQPAKSLDKQLMDEWDQYFDINLKRRKPPVLLVTTHNDMLKPQQSWQPPYDLDDSGNKKAQSIVAASRYTREKLGLSDDSLVIPIALRAGESPYNIDSLRDILIDMSSEARAAQLNRERLDAAGSRAIVSYTLSQTLGLASEGIKLIFR